MLQNPVLTLLTASLQVTSTKYPCFLIFEFKYSFAEIAFPWDILSPQAEQWIHGVFLPVLRCFRWQVRSRDIQWWESRRRSKKTPAFSDTSLSWASIIGRCWEVPGVWRCVFVKKRPLGWEYLPVVQRSLSYRRTQVSDTSIQRTPPNNGQLHYFVIRSR